MTLRQKQSVFAKNYALLILYAFNQGYEVTLGEVERPQWVQDHYVKTGASKTADSQHPKRLAGDINLFIKGVYQTKTEAYQQLGIYWVSLHPANRWGGDFRKDGNKTTSDAWDGNHFQMD